MVLSVGIGGLDLKWGYRNYFCPFLGVSGNVQEDV